MEHIRGALLMGRAAMLLSTPANMLAFQRAALKGDVDYAGAIAEGRLVLCDAQRLMARFLVDSRPDERRFRAIIGGQLRMLMQRYRGVSIYSEVVTVLLAAGRHDTAMELEQLWNQLAGDQKFDLLCAYPQQLFDGYAAVPLVDRIQGVHQYSISRPV
jgi:hypothetical protein